jgi:hypothetical protein
MGRSLAIGGSPYQEFQEANPDPHVGAIVKKKKVKKKKPATHFVFESNITNTAW